MNKKKALVLIVLILLAGAGFAAWRSRPVPTSVRLELTGTAGLKVGGTVAIDGVSQAFSGKLPATVTANAKAFEYRILMEEPNGELKASLTTGRGAQTAVGTATSLTGIRGHYASTWGGSSAGATIARPGE